MGHCSALPWPESDGLSRGTLGHPLLPISEKSDPPGCPELERVVQSISPMDMRVNPTKTKHLPVNFSKQKKGSQDLYIGWKYIEKQNVVKLLGVHIQKDLKWESHVNAIVTKASQKQRIIRKYI